MIRCKYCGREWDSLPEEANVLSDHGGWVLFTLDRLAHYVKRRKTSSPDIIYDIIETDREAA